MFGALMDLTGMRSSAFMLMYGVVWVSLIWMYWTEVRRTELMGPRPPPPFADLRPLSPQTIGTLMNSQALTPPAGRHRRLAPEDEAFWERDRQAIAYRNLWISVPALLCGFAVWGMWGIITVQMLNRAAATSPARCPTSAPSSPSGCRARRWA
jgi:hypothetical protein